jgi:hypothetical protein
VRNINKMERTILQLLQYNTIISASQYAQYYFSLRHAVRAPAPRAGDDSSEAGGDSDTSGTLGAGRGGGQTRPTAGADDNFRSKYFMAIAVAGSSRLQEQSAAVANQQGASGQPHIPTVQPTDGFPPLDGWGIPPDAASAMATTRAPMPVKPHRNADDDDDDWASRLFALGGMASSL